MYKEFYDWLIENLDNVADSAGLQKELSTRLANVKEGLTWEIGSGENKSNFFAISPNFDISNLESTEEIISHAPTLDEWEFLYAKPRKLWHRREISFLYENYEVKVDFDLWSYTLTSFKNGEFFDVNLIPPTFIFDQFSENKIVNLGYQFVQFEIGELMFLDIIDRVNILDAQESGIKVESLFDQLTDLTV